MTYDLWTEASHDYDAEASRTALLTAKMSGMPYWPFLAAASDGEDFANRVALAADRIDTTATMHGVPVEDLVGEFRRDWEGLVTHAALTRMADKAFYVVDGDKKVGGPYDTRDDAQDAIDGGDVEGDDLSVSGSDGDGKDDAKDSDKGSDKDDDDPDDDDDDSGSDDDKPAFLKKKESAVSVEDGWSMGAPKPQTATFPRRNPSAGGRVRNGYSDKARGAVYEYHPVGLDAWDPKDHQPEKGQRVRLSNKSGVGKPPGPMGKDFHYVEDADTGQFHGMVLRNSLRPEGYSAGLEKQSSKTFPASDFHDAKAGQKCSRWGCDKDAVSSRSTGNGEMGACGQHKAEMTKGAAREVGKGGPVVDSIKEFQAESKVECATCGGKKSPLANKHQSSEKEKDHAFNDPRKKSAAIGNRCVIGGVPFAFTGQVLHTAGATTFPSDRPKALVDGTVVLEDGRRFAPASRCTLAHLRRLALEEGQDPLAWIAEMASPGGEPGHPSEHDTGGSEGVAPESSPTLNQRGADPQQYGVDFVDASGWADHPVGTAP